MTRSLLVLVTIAVMSTCYLVLPPTPVSAELKGCGIDKMYDVALPGAPFSAVSMPDEQTVFVSINSTNPLQLNGIAVLHCTAGRYRLVRVIRLESQPTMMALTNDAKTLLVPDDTFIALVDTHKALNGDGESVISYIEDIPGDDGGAVYAEVSLDNQFGFVAEEQSGKVTVVDLMKMRSGRLSKSAIKSEVPVGNAPVAVVTSKDGKFLFVTVQVAFNRYNFEKVCIPEGNASLDSPKESLGAIVTVDIAKSIRDPEHSVVSTVPAGCNPVRASLSPDGSTLWVAARGSNSVLTFSVEKLIAGDKTAQLATIGVGKSPVPILVSRDGKFVLVGNSARFAAGSFGSSIMLLDPLSHSVIRESKAGLFPRQFSQTRSGSVIFVCNYGSNTVTVINRKVFEPQSARFGHSN